MFPFLQPIRDIFERNESLEEEKSGLLSSRASENWGSLRPFFRGINTLKAKCAINGKIVRAFVSWVFLERMVGKEPILSCKSPKCAYKCEKALRNGYTASQRNRVFAYRPRVDLRHRGFLDKKKKNARSRDTLFARSRSRRHSYSHCGRKIAYEARRQDSSWSWSWKVCWKGLGMERKVTLIIIIISGTEIEFANN